jgi:quercetin dioxygenase-like cupin family protein
MEIRRFGIGHRRLDGPPGTRGVEATSLHVDERGLVAELALRPHARIAPHTNPNLAYLLVIEGGGFVSVGSETARVAAGEAVVWPPNVVHAAWTELTPMRAIVVEFVQSTGSGPVEALLPEGSAPGQAIDDAKAVDDALRPDAEEPDRADGALASAGSTPAGPAPADGALAPKPAVLPPDRQSPEREPW